MSFVHLHNHSEYSLLDGMCKIDDLISQVKNLGMDSVAITDHGNLYGAFKFFIKAKDAGIKPIIGIETYKARTNVYDKNINKNKKPHHLILIAKDLTGYKNLLKLTTFAHLKGFYYKPRVDWESLEKYREGLIALSGGCYASEIANHILNNELNSAEVSIKKYIDVFGDNFYLEIQRHLNLPNQEKINTQLIKFSRKFGIPIVATNDVHYVNSEDAYAQEVMLCIQTQRTIQEKNRPL